MNNAKRLDIDDWTLSHQEMAASEGWCIVESSLRGTPHHLEIRALGNTGEENEIFQRRADDRLIGDEPAIDSMCQSWHDGNEHALLAYLIIRASSPAEFYFWGMSNWSREKTG